MKRINSFKVFRKFNENLLSQPRFSYYVFSKSQQPRWQVFKKSQVFSGGIDHKRISSFYKDLWISNRRNRICSPFLALSGRVSILQALLEVKFVRSFREANFLVKNGYVLLNGSVVKFSNVTLISGDSIQVVKQIDLLLLSTYFFSKFRVLTCHQSLVSRYEVSFCCQTFIFCF